MVNDGKDEGDQPVGVIQPSPSESRTVFGLGREKSDRIFPLSVKTDLGSALEQEYDDLGDQGMVQKYGSKLAGVERVPEIDNMPIFIPEDFASDAGRDSIAGEGGSDISATRLMLEEFASGERQVAKSEIVTYTDAIAKLMAVEALGVDVAEIELCVEAVVNAGKAFRRAQMSSDMSRPESR